MASPKFVCWPEWSIQEEAGQDQQQVPIQACINFYRIIHLQFELIFNSWPVMFGKTSCKCRSQVGRRFHNFQEVQPVFADNVRRRRARNFGNYAEHLLARRSLLQFVHAIGYGLENTHRRPLYGNFEFGRRQLKVCNNICDKHSLSVTQHLLNNFPKLIVKKENIHSFT